MPVASASDPVTARRILVYGVTGSGKSTAASRAAGLLGLPYVPIDDLGWQAGWVPTDPDELRQVLGDLAARDAWVIDANYSVGRDVIDPRIELVVGLDYPRWFSFQRLVRRTVTRIVSQTPVCNGNRETWRKAFLDRDSIFVWHFKSFRRKRRQLEAYAAAPVGPPALLFRRPRDLEAWISRL